MEQGSIQKFIKLQLSEDLFRDSEVQLYEVIRSHIAQYGAIPKAETITTMPDFASALVQAPEPMEYYMHEVEQRYLNTTLTSMVSTSISLLKEKKGEETLDLVKNAVSTLFALKNRQHLFDLRTMSQLIGSEYAKSWQEGDSALMYGWPTLDAMTGGLRAGDLASFVGRPAAGKTFKLLKVAHNAWVSNNTPLFVSMEMNTTIIAQRIAALHTHTPLTKLLKAELVTPVFKNLMEGLVEVQGFESPFWVVDGNFSTTVEDIMTMCHQLKPGSVFVDGAYLLKHPNARMNKFERISENCELLKQQIATDLEIPTVVSYQLNRDVLKKKKDQKAGVEDIYGSDSIGQLSTVVLGLFQEEGVETMHRRRVEILKGRNGEVGEFNINWEFNKMNFDEVPKEEQKQDLQFLG